MNIKSAFKNMKETKKEMSFPTKKVYSQLYDRDGNNAIVMKDGRLYMDFGDGVTRTKKFSSAAAVDKMLRNWGMVGPKTHYK